MADYIKLYHFSGKFFGLLLNQFVILPGLFGKYRGQGALVLTQKVQVKLQTGPKVIQKIYQKSGRVFIVPKTDLIVVLFFLLFAMLT